MAGAGQARPLITFHAPGGRTFQRIFRDATLSETKDAVRQKLKWPAHEEISLARIEDGRHIDLDDDDDFDAFRIATRSKPTVEVSVTVGSSSIPAGPSINHAQPPADLPSSLPPSEPTSVLAVSRKRKRLRPSMAPGDERALSIDRGSGTPVNATGASTPTTHAGVSSVQVLPGASRPGAQDADVERPRKKRKKLKFREPSVQDSVERSASNPPPSYVPPTPDSLASGLSPLASLADAHTDSPAKTTHTVPASDSPMKRKMLKKRKRKSTVDPSGDPDVAASLLAPGSSLPVLAPPGTEASSAESPATVKTESKAKKHKMLSIFASGPTPTSDVGPSAATTTPVAEAQEVPPSESPVKKRKKEKTHTEVDGPAESQTLSESAPHAQPEGSEPETKKPKSKKAKKSESRATDPQVQAHAAPSTEPAKRSKKARLAEATEQPVAEAAVDDDPGPIAADVLPPAAEGSTKSKTKRRGKDKEPAPSAAEAPTAPEPAAEPNAKTVADAVAFMVATREREEAGKAAEVISDPGPSGLLPPVALAKPFDTAKAIADAMATIAARHKANKLGNAADASGPSTPRVDVSKSPEEPSAAPVAGPSDADAALPSKEKRKSKSKKASTASVEHEPATPAEDSATKPKPKSKKRKGDDSVMNASNAAPPTQTDADKSAENAKAVQAAVLAVMRRQSTATPQPTVISQQLSVPAPKPEPAPKEASASAKAKKLKEKAAKAKPIDPEPTDSAHTAAVDSGAPGSPSGTSVTVVETPAKRQRKTKAAAAKATSTDVPKPARKDAEAIVPSPLNPIPAVDKHAVSSKPVEPAAPVVSSQSTSPESTPSPASRLLSNVQNSSPPRPPAHSDVDEVTVERRGEGSSDEGSSSDESDEEEEDPVPDLSQVDVEALLRGPAPRKSILEGLPSDSEEEDSDEKQSEAGDDEEEEVKLDKKYRRMSKRFERQGSSSDEEMGPDAAAEEEEEVVAATFMDVDPQDTVEGQIDARNTPTVVAADQTDDEPMPTGVAEPSSPSAASNEQQSSEASVEAAARQVSPTVSMMEEEHRKDDGRVISTPPHGEEEVQSSQEVRAPEPPTTAEQNESASSEKADTADAQASPLATSPVKPAVASPSSKHQPLAGEEPADPIEPADDLIVPESPNMSEVDPIELEPEPSARPSAPERQQNTPPPLPVSRPSTVKRMKGRDGKVGTPRPVLASELPALDLTAIHSFVELDEEATPSQLARRSTRRTSSGNSMPPPPDPAPAPAAESAPKKRGRPPIPQEEKDRRKAEKERLAAERKAKREADKAVKQAEKARLLKEKAAAKKGGKAAKKAAPVVESEDEDEDAQPVVGAQRAPAGVHETPKGVSQRPGWTTLTQTPQTQEGSLAEGESMMIDELRSSSPAHSSPRIEPVKTPRKPASKRKPASQSQKAATQPQPSSSQPYPEAQAGSQQQDVIPSSDPLFLPGSSQVPFTPMAPLPAPTQRAASPSGSSASSDSKDSEPIAARSTPRLHNSRPWLKDMPFRRLSDLASQSMFTPSSVFTLTPVAAKKDKAWGKADESESDEDESDDDEDDDEDEGEAGKKSHIPQDRRAGAGVQKKKMSGLASFAK